ncbi:MAG TPA: transcriptional regulator [Candidatus Cloacimonadota bacterium]|nr:transcriptional regulator [Candidatus Cloacimonadota bacterium]
MKHQEVIQKLAGLDLDIHSPARLMIIFLLSRCRSLDYLKLMELTGLTSGNITTHLNRLAESGYIRITKSFRGKKPHTAVELTDTGKTSYQAWGKTILLALPEQQWQELFRHSTDTPKIYQDHIPSFRQWFFAVCESDSRYLHPEAMISGSALPPKDEMVLY